jgi:hypothetical protein
VSNGGSNDEIADALNAHQVRFTVVAAVKGRQESFERADFGGGVFTSAIAKAITDPKRSSIDTIRTTSSSYRSFIAASSPPH